MGACCSSPAQADAQPVHVSRAPASGFPRGHSDPTGELVHVLATVRTAQQRPAGGPTHHQHHQHHHHHHQHSSVSYSSHAPKQLLRATSPPLQSQHQQQSFGLSPRSFEQLQQLLPSAPLQQLASGQHTQAEHQQEDQQHMDVSHSKDTTLLSSHSRAAGAFVQARPSLHLQDQQRHSIDREHTLQQLHSVDSGHSITSRSSSTLMSGGSGAAGTRELSGSKAPADALRPAQVLAVCAAVLQEDADLQAAGITPLLLAAVCLIESGGCPHAKQYREHLGDTAHGMCQMLLSTATWLAASQGFDRHGSSISVKDLEDPKTCVYFAAAYLAVLSHYGGSPRSESFVTRAYHAGPKAIDTAAGRMYLQKYLKAKHCLTEVTKAMALTVAAAALAAKVPLPGHTTCVSVGVALEPELPADADVRVATVPAIHSSSRDQPGKDQGSVAAAADAAVSSTTSVDGRGATQDAANASSGTTSSTSSSSRQAHVRQATADLVAMLCSTWDDDGCAAAGSAGRLAGAGLGAGSILAHMLPSRWSLTGTKQHQGHPHGTRRGDSGEPAAESALQLVGIEAGTLATAWQRLMFISPAVAQAALDQAMAAAAMAPHPSEDWPPRSLGAAGAAAAPARRGGVTQRSSASSSSASSSRNSRSKTPVQKASEQLPAAQALESMPCVMHVLGHGESLQHIAKVCNVGLSDLLAANPEVSEADAVHHNDCIALPVPAVFPRLYVTQPGDTLHSIARAHEVSMGRVLAKNPELADPSSIQPGWVVALPGLKGDSQVALPLDWLQQASSLPTPDSSHQAAWARVPAEDGGVAPCEAVSPAAEGIISVGRQGASAGHQPLPAAVRAAADSTGHHQRCQHPRQLRLLQQGQALAPSLLSPAGAEEQVVLHSHLQQQQQQQLLPTVGSGAFLFTVIDDGSSSQGSLGGQAPAGLQQAGPHAAKSGVNMRKGGNAGDGADLPKQDSQAPRDWTVGTAAGYVH